MSDFNETEATEIPAETPAEVSAKTSAEGDKFNEGDHVGVTRGKLRGQRGRVISYDPDANQYAVKLESGTLVVLNAASVKAPADSTVSVRALVRVLAAFQDTDLEVVSRLAAALEPVAPGISAKLNKAPAS